jgi:pyruvate-formate lyase
MRWFIDRFVEAFNLWCGIRENHLAYPFNSALLDGCIESGKDALAAGSKWGKEYMSVLRPFGHQNTVNSLAAMKKLVYEEKKVEMGELLDALSKNFEGKEKLHAQLLAAPKWGNDDDYVDDLMKDLFTFTGEYITSKKNHWGGQWLCSRQGLTLHFFFGQVDGALPDGRKAWIPLADASVSAFRGTDKKGPTAVYNSAAKVDHVEFTEATLLNLKFSPGPLQTVEGRRKFVSMIKNYFDRYGHHVQFNIFNAETLLDAKKHPEKHRDLVVRVAGFSAYFVELGPAVQDEIIGRTMCTM